MQEKNLYPRIRQWLKANPRPSAGYEPKYTSKSSLPFSCLAEHQERALVNAKHSQLIYKIPDDSIGYKPLDIFSICKGEAYVVVAIQSKTMYFIDIDVWIEERDNSTRKSLTLDRAKQIAAFTV